MIGQCHCGKDGHALNSVNCPVHGWRPPVVYDQMTDKTVVADQGHVDELVAIKRAYRDVAEVVGRTFRDFASNNVHVLNGRSIYDSPRPLDPMKAMG